MPMDDNNTAQTWNRKELSQPDKGHLEKKQLTSYLMVKDLNVYPQDQAQDKATTFATSI